MEVSFEPGETVQRCFTGALTRTMTLGTQQAGTEEACIRRGARVLGISSRRKKAPRARIFSHLTQELSTYDILYGTQ